MNPLIKEIKKRKIFNETFIFGNGKKITSHKKFLKKMRFSDILILSSGVSLQEGISQKKMIFVTFVSQNQKSFYDYYKKKGLIKDIKYFKRFTKFSDSKILKLIKENQKKFVRFNNNNLSRNDFWRKLNA